MKALVADAEWAPKEDYELKPFEKRTGRAINSSKIYKNPTMEITDVPKPEPESNEVLIQVKACGICGSDIHLLPNETDEEGYTHYAGLTKLPSVLGHEFSGKVVEVGEQVDDFNPGDPVTAEEMIWCGKCKSCRNGFPNHCQDINEIGFSIDGAYAEYVSVPERVVWKLDEIFEFYDDEETSYEVGATVEPTSVAYNGIFIRAGGFQPGATVAVYGTGPIGLGASALTKAAGAAKVIAFEVSAERRKLAEKRGADHVFDPSKVVPSEAIMELTNGEGVDLSIEAAGVPEKIMPEIEKTVAVNGKILQIGRAPKRVELDLETLINNRAEIYGTLGHSGHKIFPSVIKLLGSGLIDNTKVITADFPLEETIEAIKQSKDKTDGKILVKP